MPPHSGARPGDKMDGYVRALHVFEDWLVRRERGDAESREELLEAHPDLRDDLDAMLEADVTAEDLDLDATMPGASHTLPEATQDFGDYRILEQIGQGGMGAVYLAQHRELGRRVALKVIRPERLFSAVAKERFAREARAVAQLDHPNVCPVFDVGEADGVPFMAMRYLEGASLAQLIANAQAGAPLLTSSDSATGSSDSGPSTRSAIHAVVELVEAIARGLHAAHESGIIHRDIKPGNIHVTTDGTPLLLDFGLARPVDDEAGTEPQLTMSDDLPGTPLYMSPEQILPGERGLDRTTDVYSLGVTLYECLTLRRPFDGASLRELQDSILTAPLVRPRRRNPHVPRDLEIVVEKALDRDRERRYRTAEELAEDLRRVRSFEPILARRPGVVLRARRWVQRYPWAAAVMTVAVVCSVVITVLLLLTNEAKREYDEMSWVVKLEEGQAAERALYADRAQRIRETRSRAARLESGPFEAWLRDHGDPAAEILRRLRETMKSVLSRSDGDPATPRFASRVDRFKHDTLKQLIANTTRFVEHEWGETARVRTQVTWNESVMRDTIDAAAARWLQAVADVAANPKYRGLVLLPQVGLLPLGKDRHSQLEEFAHVRSGVPPERDPETGRLKITKDTGLVFVLLPGGTFGMGAQKLDPDGPNFDPMARDHESDGGRIQSVTLGPFLLSKYEMTQGQWARLNGGEQRSVLRAGRRDKGGKRSMEGRLMTLVHPVEAVSWNRANACMRMYGLELPTEAQWEYACRAGSDAPWFIGGDHRKLRGHVNFADQSAARSGFSQIDDWPELVDGYAAHAPVDAFEPNAFGFHNMCGNVWEHCREWFMGYSNPVTGDDGFRRGNGRQRILRGGSFDQSYKQARSAYRSGLTPSARGGSIGLRPARSLDR